MQMVGIKPKMEIQRVTTAVCAGIQSENPSGQIRGDTANGGS